MVPAPPYLNHMVDTDPVSEAKHLPVPIRNFLVVHRVVRPNFCTRAIFSSLLDVAITRAP
jgi:hypothetical protein